MPLHDTSADAAAVQLEVQRRLGPTGRFRLAVSLSEFTRELARAGLRQRRPDLTEAGLRRELVRQLYELDIPLP